MTARRSAPARRSSAPRWSSTCTTIVVYPGQRATVDAFGNYVITLG